MDVSTIILSRNHQIYIVEAIESALRQVGDFKHEIIISDDGSTDGTPEIIDKYCQKYPRVIRSIGSSINVGISDNYKRCFAAAKGEYIAILEADDYWSINDKLAKQACFLSKNKTAKMVFSKLHALGPNSHKYFTYETQVGLPELLTGHDLARSPDLNPIINFSSVMINSGVAKNLPSEVFSPRFSEITLGFYIDTIGKIGYIDEFMSVYRINPNGFWSGASKYSKIKQAIDIRKSSMAVASPIYKKLIEENLSIKEIELINLDVQS